jgi:glycosyltransferase involved in cell wall biosynthesis
VALDIVVHQDNGYLARPYDPLDLTEGIGRVLSRDAANARALVDNARKTTVSRLSIEAMTSRYIALFREVLGPSRAH